MINLIKIINLDRMIICGTPASHAHATLRLPFPTLYTPPPHTTTHALHRFTCHLAGGVLLHHTHTPRNRYGRVKMGVGEEQNMDDVIDIMFSYPTRICVFTPFPVYTTHGLCRACFILLYTVAFYTHTLLHTHPVNIISNSMSINVVWKVLT